MANNITDSDPVGKYIQAGFKFQIPSKDLKANCDFDFLSRT